MQDSLSQGLLSNDNHELRQKHLMYNHAVPVEAKEERK